MLHVTALKQDGNVDIERNISRRYRLRHNVPASMALEALLALCASKRITWSEMVLILSIKDDLNQTKNHDLIIKNHGRLDF